MKLVNDLRPRDYLEALGPLSLVVLFGFVLYAIHAGHQRTVEMTRSLMFWPLYQFIGLLVENSLMNFLLARNTKKENDYLMAVGPFLLLVGIMSLFSYSHWVLLVVSFQLLHLLFQPKGSWEQERGCMDGFIKSIALLMVLILVIFGIQEILSKPFDMPLSGRGYDFLPGMLIIGVLYYSLSAALDVLMQPLMRGAAQQT